ncbi:MAG: 3'-5' exonuclease [Sulfurospirillaceae bacterium]|nr:3'-5' exonuclease [Sulfurospirillaceae bacterium]
MQNIDILVQKIIKDNLSKEEFIRELKTKKPLVDIDVDDFENLRLLGFPVQEIDNQIIIETANTKLEEQTFCVVDIEANGSDPQVNQIIEIGAVMVRNGEEIDKFESFVETDVLPDSITMLTGITLDDLKGAPPLNFVLEKFRLFLKDAVFVAHNVNFDYNFISASLQKAGFGPLLNRKLCTIDLSRKCFQAEKYGLSFLMEHFDISFGAQHRALVDAKMADFVLRHCLQNLPVKVSTTEDLIQLSKPIKKKKKKTKDKNSYN